MPDFTLEMRDPTLAVDEGVENDTQEICLTLDIAGGGSVQCELTVTLSTTAGTAGMFSQEPTSKLFYLSFFFACVGSFRWK